MPGEEVGLLSERTSERVTGVSGALFVIGAVVGFGVLVGSVPGPGAEGGEVRDFLARSEARVWTGGYLGLLAVLAFLVFAGGLWNLLRTAEGGTGWISTVGLAAATANVAVTVSADLVPGAAVFREGTRVDAEVASILLEGKHFAEMVTVPLIGLFLASAALVSLRTGALPRWAGWSAALVAAASVLGVPLGYETSQIPVFLAALWILAVSVRLLARPSGFAAAA
jgi:hypothetical protein